MTKALPEVAVALLKAKALIDTPQKWCKHDYRVPYWDAYSYCAVGALMYAQGGDNTPHEAFGSNYLSQAIKKLYPELDGTIADFNDAPTTTHAMVMAAYDLAIQLAHRG